MAAIGNGGP